MAEWSRTISFTDEDCHALDAFIHEPHTRQSDIFKSDTLPVEHNGHTIEWIIKHDLFEGVVAHVSLLADSGTRYVAGDGLVLSQAADAFHTFTLHDGDTQYTVTIHPA